MIGECAISELKEYFENRSDREQINISYIDGHFAMTEFLKHFRKTSKISLKQLSTMFQLSFAKIIAGMIGAKLHKSNFKSVIELKSS